MSFHFQKKTLMKIFHVISLGYCQRNISFLKKFVLYIDIEM